LSQPQRRQQAEGLLRHCADARIVAVQSRDARRLNRNWGVVRIPKVGWVRFRWSRAVP
jgi:hypothetical protein